MIWRQQWLDVLFIHFPVPAAELQPHVPPQVEVDCFAGQAWISYVFFRLKLRASWLPFVPGFSALLELNVRTYVRHRDQPGIYFLQMYADNRLAIHAARWLTPLLYLPAAMVDEPIVGGGRRVVCRPHHSERELLRCEYRVPATMTPCEPRSLDAWLLERYRLYVAAADGSLVAADVEHSPWHAATVAADGWEHAPGDAWGLTPAAMPAVIHHSPGVAARFNAFVTVAAAGSLPGTSAKSRLHSGNVNVRSISRRAATSSSGSIS